MPARLRAWHHLKLSDLWRRLATASPQNGKVPHGSPARFPLPPEWPADFQRRREHALVSPAHPQRHGAAQAQCPVQLTSWRPSTFVVHTRCKCSGSMEQGELPADSKMLELAAATWGICQGADHQRIVPPVTVSCYSRCRSGAGLVSIPDSTILRCIAFASAGVAKWISLKSTSAGAQPARAPIPPARRCDRRWPLA